jgi:hypothetical protein
MKKTLLAGVAALSVLCTSAAHAHDAELPDWMFGAWCEVNNPALARALPNNELYSKCENGNLFIFDKGYKYKAGGSCEFASIKFDRSEGEPSEDAYDVFVVRANCKGIVDVNGNPYLYSEFFEIATSEGQLSRRFLPKDSAHPRPHNRYCGAVPGNRNSARQSRRLCPLRRRHSWHRKRRERNRTLGARAMEKDAAQARHCVRPQD